MSCALDLQGFPDQHQQDGWIADGELTRKEGFLCGGLAACTAVTVSNPAEVAKTRLQLDGELQSTSKVRVAPAAGGAGGAAAVPPAAAEYKKVYNSAFDALRKTWHYEGISGVQRGLSAAYAYQIMLSVFRIFGCRRCRASCCQADKKSGNAAMARDWGSMSLSDILPTELSVWPKTSRSWLSMSFPELPVVWWCVDLTTRCIFQSSESDFCLLMHFRVASHVCFNADESCVCITAETDALLLTHPRSVLWLVTHCSSFVNVLYCHPLCTPELRLATVYR